jgi:hypothetical protein
MKLKIQKQNLSATLTHADFETLLALLESGWTISRAD